MPPRSPVRLSHTVETLIASCRERDLDVVYPLHTRKQAENDRLLLLLIHPFAIGNLLLQWPRTRVERYNRVGTFSVSIGKTQQLAILDQDLQRRPGIEGCFFNMAYVWFHICAVSCICIRLPLACNSSYRA